jgi:vitamin B12 transporter
VFAFERLDETARSGAFAADASRGNDALVLGYSGRFGAQLWQFDWRHDSNSQFGDVDTGRVGWSVELASGWRARALAGTSFRAPSFNDLYFPGFGIATLRPERGRSIEAGLSRSAGDSSASVTLYRNRVRDLIGFESDRSSCPADPAYDFGCARNIGRARLQGASLAAAHRIGVWHLRANLELLDAKDETTGQRLARRAAHQESVAADYAAGAWSFGLALLDVGARPDAGARLGAYQTVDLQARRRIDRHWRIEATLLNAADRRIEPVRDYEGLGRQAWIGVRYSGAGVFGL